MRITKSKEWYHRAKWITWLLAWACCLIPTILAGVLKLPFVVAKEAGQTLTGGAIIVLACCAYPILKGLLKALKSPSAWFILWILALVTLALYNVPHETLGALATVFLTAAIGNSLGAFLFWLSREFEKKYVTCGQIVVKEGGDKV